MRIISGVARGTKLYTLDGENTRPTLDRIKEPLFSIIQMEIKGAIVLDLFSGSGALALEALSRGANACTFIENNPKAVLCIKDNLKHTKLDSKAIVYRQDAVSFLQGLKEVCYDVIFMDPPYGRELEKSALEVLSNKEFTADTLIVVEAAIDEDFSYVEELGFDIWKEKLYKTNKHIFIEKRN